MVLPQLEFARYFSQIFWVIFFIGILFCFFYFIIFPRFISIVHLRQRENHHIQKEIMHIEREIIALKNEMEMIIKDHEVFKVQKQNELNNDLYKMSEEANKKISEEFKENFKKLEMKLDTEKEEFFANYKKDFNKEFKKVLKKLDITEVKK